MQSNEWLVGICHVHDCQSVFFAYAFFMCILCWWLLSVIIIIIIIFNKGNLPQFDNPSLICKFAVSYLQYHSSSAGF